MQDKFIKFANARNSLLILCLMPVLNLFLNKWVSLVIFGLLTVLIIVWSVIRLYFEQKSTGIYILYASEIFGTLAFYCLHIAYGFFVPDNEVNVILNLLSVIFVVPLIFEIAKHKTEEQ